MRSWTQTSETILLRWPGGDEGGHYRVLVRSPGQSPVLVSPPVDRPWTEVERNLFAGTEPRYWQAQWRPPGEKEWQELTPAFRLRLPDDGPGVTRLRWRDAGASAYRVLIRDDTTGEYVLKDATQGPVYALHWDELDPAHEHRWRAQIPAAGGGWEDLTELKRLRARRRGRAGVPGAGSDLEVRPDPDAHRLLFMFTVDTEAGVRRMRTPEARRAVDELIFGEFGDGERNGVDLQMDLLESFGMRCCFFLDILMEYQFGAGALVPVVERILDRGHEIQLHLHATHLSHSRDPALTPLSRALVADDPELFRRAMEVATELFVERVGYPPIAYRSGSYHLCDAFLAVLPEFGIRIDSSLNPRKNCRAAEWMKARTQPFWIGDLLEVPVSNMIRRGDASEPLGLRQLAPARAGSQLAFASIPTDERNAPAVLTYVSHSYQFLEVHRESGADVSARWHEELIGRNPGIWEQWASTAEESFSFFGPRVDAGRVEILLRLLDELSARHDVASVTYAELDRLAAGRFRSCESPLNDPVPVYDSRARCADVTAARTLNAELLRTLEAEAEAPAKPTPAPSLDPLLDELDLRGARVAVWSPDRGEELARGLRARGAGDLWQVEGGERLDGATQDELDAVVLDQVIHGAIGDALGASLAEWRRRCRDGARLIVASPTVFSHRGAGVTPALRTPLAHLLFGLPAIEQAFPERDLDRVNPFCAESYLRAFERAGFTLERLVRDPPDADLSELMSSYRGKLGWFDPEELASGGFTAILVAGGTAAATGAETPGDGVRALLELWPVPSGARVLCSGPPPEIVASLLSGPASVDSASGRDVAADYDLIVLASRDASIEELSSLITRARPGGRMLAALSLDELTADSWIAALSMAGGEVARCHRLDGDLLVELYRALEPADITGSPDVIDVRADQAALEERRIRMMRERERERSTPAAEGP